MIESLYYFAEGMLCMRIEKMGEKICRIFQNSSWLTVPSVCGVAGGNDISSCKFRTQRMHVVSRAFSDRSVVAKTSSNGH